MNSDNAPQIVKKYDANPFVNKQTRKIEEERKKFETLRQKQGLPVVSLFSDYITKITSAKTIDLQ